MGEWYIISPAFTLQCARHALWLQIYSLDIRGSDRNEKNFINFPYIKPLTVVRSHVPKLMDPHALLKCDRDITALMTGSRKARVEIEWLHQSCMELSYLQV